MARMEFLNPNLVNTTSMTVVNSNTDTAQYLFDRNVSIGYSSSGLNTAGTSAVISIKLPSNTVISHVFIQNHNLKSFRIYYNSVTANSLHNTTTNSATSTYIAFSSVTVNSVDIQMTDTINASEEKELGELYIGYRQLQFERNPAIENFEPRIFRKQIRHEMPDGGVVLYNVRDKYRTNLRWEFITDGFHTSLLTLYRNAQPLYFLPEPTTTAWNGEAYEVVMSGEFDFKHSTNDKTQGRSGGLDLEQTPSG